MSDRYHDDFLANGPGYIPGDPYDITDPKNPSFYETHVDKADQERKRLKEEGPQSGPVVDGPCPACGQKKRKPRTEQTKAATPKERSRLRIDIPAEERAHGYDEFMETLGRVRVVLGPELGYTQDTPNWFVLFAVLTDWLNTNEHRQAA